MSQQLLEHLRKLTESGQAEVLKGLQHGIEKEGLRVDCKGRLAQTDHPQSLGSALTNSRITTDYSEALLEFITPVFADVEQAISFLEELHRYTFKHLEGETIWSGSMPCHLSGPDEVPIARFGSSNIGRMKHIYRVGLEHRYGKVMQTIAGIHYNFSLPQSFWPIYQKICNDQSDIQDFQSASYFALIRNFRRYSWLLIYLFGASPAVSRSFTNGNEGRLQLLDPETLYSPYATSLRMSDLGYSNQAQAALNVCYNHLDNYVKTLSDAIKTPYPDYERIGVKVDGQYRQLNSNLLQIENEYYSDIRPKRVIQSGEKPIRALKDRGVEYVEVRNTDINPYLPVGIDAQQSRFLDSFLLFCLFLGNDDISDEECDRIKQNHHRVAWQGRDPQLKLQTDTGEILLTDQARELLNQILPVAELLDSLHDRSCHSKSVVDQRSKIDNPDLTPSGMMLKQMREQNLSHDEFIRQRSVQHHERLKAEPLAEYRYQELSRLAEQSLIEQQALEQQSEPSFEHFLEEYFRPSN
ncbi:glutamate--cysteine ligase [Motiliproteus sp. MSK22-1]|uniref:glutamate--cysteine ligase n=1 Tax=Motiliproteus sp. MSK22-1 TaxID=1897630 RepID=UPI0009756062|nr:glutamate--cysteine ligase [Motiliproteus sp. MSK22-1]OMH39710.1 glutamate--cysteine ligase [Motiliproteus sp. MSK22-1]